MNKALKESKRKTILIFLLVILIMATLLMTLVTSLLQMI